MFQQVEYPDAKEIYVGELVERGEWVTAAIHAPGSWPVKLQKTVYRGETMFIVPVTREHYPMLAMKLRHGGPDRKAAEILLMRFLSILSWWEGRGYRTDGVGGGSMPFPMGRSENGGYMVCEYFDLDDMPEPWDEKALLALALLREGRSLNHPGYAFLAFYRVLEVALKSTKARKDWMDINVNDVDGSLARRALKELRAQGITKVGEHMFVSRRCAMAHASAQPIVDPDDPTDLRKLWQDLPIMEGLAALAIERELGVKSARTIWREHRYELAGFKTIFGPEVVDYLRRGYQLPGERHVDVPKLSVRLKGKEPYPSLEGMTVGTLQQQGSIVHMTLEADDGLAHVKLKLDFANERIEFNMFRDIYTKENGSVAAAKAAVDVNRFCDELFLNGCIRIERADTGEIISRKDAYLPENLRYISAAAAAEAARLKAEVTRREQRDAAYGSEIKRLSVPYAIRTSLTIDMPQQ